MSDDRTYMQRAIELAQRAAGFTSPNPMVGCVLVKDGAVVGEGWHERAGLPHAEANAIAAAGTAAKGATAYVTLEPCNHQGRTPPCAEALIAAGVAEVVYAVADPHVIAAGGAARLEAAGIRTRGGVCEKEARALNRFWFHAVEKKRPFFIAKFAMSLDGKIATRTGESQWITGDEARARGHELRQAVDAVAVGANTVIADDPSLTTRLDGRDGANPRRIVLDTAGRTSPGANVYSRTEPGAMIVSTAAMSAARRAAYEEHGVDVLELSAGADNRPDLDELPATLYARGVQSVMIEGGAQLLGAFFDAGLIDEVWAFIAPIVIGGEAKTPVAGRGVGALSEAWRIAEPNIEHLGRDILLRGSIDRSDRERRV